LAIRMRRPVAAHGAAERRGVLTSKAPSLRSRPARRLPGGECGLLAQEPAQGSSSNASGATTGATVRIVQLSLKLRLHSPNTSPNHQPQPPALKDRWAAWRASVPAIARHAGQRTACPFAAWRRAGAARAARLATPARDAIAPWATLRSRNDGRTARPLLAFVDTQQRA